MTRPTGTDWHAQELLLLREVTRLIGRSTGSNSRAIASWTATKNWLSRPITLKLNSSPMMNQMMTSMFAVFASMMKIWISASIEGPFRVASLPLAEGRAVYQQGNTG